MTRTSSYNGNGEHNILNGQTNTAVVTVHVTGGFSSQMDSNPQGTPFTNMV